MGILPAFEQAYEMERRADDPVGSIVHHLDAKARKGESLILEEHLITLAYETYSGK